MTGSFRRFLSGWFGVCAVAIFVASSAALAVRLQGQADEPATNQPPPIQIFADWSQEWTDGPAHVALFRGHCRIVQGRDEYTAEKMVVWVKRDNDDVTPRDEVSVYFEGHVTSKTDDGDFSAPTHAVQLETMLGITLTVRGRKTDAPATEDALYRRATQRRKGLRRGDLLQTQFTLDPTNPGVQALPVQGLAGQIRRVRIFQRGAVPFNLQMQPVENSNPPEQIIFITGGLQLLIDSADAVIPGMGEVGTVDLSADRAVIWTTALNGNPNPLESVQGRDTPYEVYLEGNIVFRQGNNVVRADRAFYDAREERALIYNAELKAFMPDLDMQVRVRAERLRQTSRNSSHAQNAWLSTSEFGKPGYRLQASDVFVDQIMSTPEDGAIVPMNPVTGQPMLSTQPLARVNNATLFVEDVPVFWLPSVTVPTEDPGIPIQSITFRQDRVFGTQLRTRWDAFQLFGLDKPENTRWSLELDYLSQRGPLLGTDGAYRGVDQQGRPYFGEFLASYVHDDGHDNLGLDRRSLEVEDSNRGRAMLRDRHIFSESLSLQTEFGFSSDRNYLEQYYENEFDTGKDQETLGYLRWADENYAASLLARPQINPYENDAQWLPKADGYVLNEPLLGGWLNWSTHTSAAYANLQRADAPTDPNDLFSPLPYYTSADGLVAMSRHEVTAPFNVGALKIAPYALGEAAYWSDGFTQESIDRYYGRAGIRASILFSRVFPYVRSDLFNLNGLNHKMTFDVDYGYAQSSRSLAEVPQWNEFDDNAQERFRERLLFNTFGGALPPQFDPRFFAVRSGAGGNVTDPYHELVDDMHAVRLGWRHRLQTKVGPPERQRIKDWMTLDLGITVFPDANRDNFGKNLGLFTTRYAWNVGDRTSIIASSLWDFYPDAPHLWSVGILSQRSVRGSLYVGFRQIEAGSTFNSQILTASYSYQMSPKWISTASTAFDVAEGQNRGQALTVTRVGEWFLFHTGFNFDASKNNVGAVFAVEPRLGSKGITTPQLGPLMQNY